MHRSQGETLHRDWPDVTVDQASAVYLSIHHADSRVNNTPAHCKVRRIALLVASGRARRSTAAAGCCVEPGLPAVAGHFPTLVQIVTNLLSNALKFVPPGQQPRVRIFGEQRAATVRLWIEDNGIGIAPQHHERIFQVFERLHGVETYAGSGIGLAIVRRGIERIGGQAGVESADDQGGRFWIELPAASDMA